VFVLNDTGKDDTEFATVALRGTVSISSGPLKVSLVVVEKPASAPIVMNLRALRLIKC